MARTLRIRIKRMREAHDFPLPAYRSAGAAGLDLFAAIEKQQLLAPNARLAIPCGVAIALPKGYEAQIRPDWTLASLHGVTVINSPGTIDSDFRGEVSVLLINLGSESIAIQRGMCVAQMVVKEVPRIKLLEVSELPSSSRSSGGFGHTGK